MKKMKKLVSVVMSVAMVYSLTGCETGRNSDTRLRRIFRWYAGSGGQQ